MIWAVYAKAICHKCYNSLPILNVRIINVCKELTEA